MIQFLKEYIKVIAMAITGVIFVLASFYFIINYYHSNEVSKQIYIGESDVKLVAYRNTLSEIKSNLDIYSTRRLNDYSSKRYLYNDLTVCYNAMIGPDVYYSIKANRYYSPYDIYELGGKFQSEIINVCWALHLSSINTDVKYNDFHDIRSFIVTEVDGINKQNRNAMEELLNNSSYYYTTNITSSTVRNPFLSDYNMIVDSYQEFANIILNLSKIMNEEGK